MSSKVIVVSWPDMKRADKALKNLKKARDEKVLDVGDAVVIVKDEKGKLKVKQTEDLTTKRGAVYGGIAGLVIGTMVGGPIGGILLGGATGALMGKIDIGVPDDEVKAVADSMEDASSAIIAQIEGGNMDLLAAAVRDSGGKVHEFGLSDEHEADLEKTLASATGMHQ
jgi:uncharacterized membrane protein